MTDPDDVTESFTVSRRSASPADPYRIDFGDSSVEGIIVDVHRPAVRPHVALGRCRRDEQTLVAWTIEPLRRGGSPISLEHSGWPATTRDDSTRDDHGGYWQAYLEDLEALLTG